MKTICITLMLALGAGMAAGQDFSQEVTEKMKAFEFLTGTWNGSGWVDTPGGRQSSNVTEVVTYESGETVLQLKGLGTKTVDGKEVTVHDALGILYFDFREKKYRIHSFISKGMNTLAEVELLEPGKFKWWFQAGPKMVIKYTLTSEGDIWTEIGEMSNDGETWRQFFEMKLQKVSN